MLDLYVNVGNSLSALEQSLRIAISNADNFNTPGYKYSFASFATVFNKVLEPAKPVDGQTFINPISAGASMTVGSTSTDFKQGNLSIGTPMDVALSGDGFFILGQTARDADESSSKVYTRNGRFQVDAGNKYITDAFGRKVFGFKLNKNGTPVGKALAPLETGSSKDLGFIEGGILVNNFQANKDAILRGDDEIPELEPLFQLAVSSFQNKQGLVIVDGGAFQATVAAGKPFEPGTSGQGPYGDVLKESLESSNISVAKVALDMALQNRGFSAIQGVINDINKITSDLISKLSG